MAAASRVFDGVDDSLLNNSAPATAVPISMAVAFKPVGTAFGGLVYILDKDVNNSCFGIELQNTAGGDVVTAISRSAAEGIDAASSTAGATRGAWNVASCSFRSATSRDIYLNGGSKGSNTAANTPAAVDRVCVGQLSRLSATGTLDGKIGYVCIWNVGLSDAEHAALGAGVAPWLIQPANIIFLLNPDDLGDAPPVDSDGSLTMTVAGATIDNADLAPLNEWTEEIADNFNRADGAIGANWSASHENILVDSNQAVGATADEYCAAQHVTSLSSADQYVEVTAGTLHATEAFIETLLRLDGSLNGYGWYYERAASNAFVITRWDADVSTDIATISQAVAPGDVIRFECVGSVFRAYLNGALKLSVTDATHNSGRKAGIAFWPTGTNDADSLDDFSAGVLGAGTGDITGSASASFTAVGTLSGTGALTGTVASAFTATGTLTGSGALIGAAAFVFSPVGALKGAGALVGSSGLTFSVSGAFSISSAIDGQPSVVLVDAYASLTLYSDGDGQYFTI